MKIFLGYPSEYLTVAREVFDMLKSLGHEVWFDKVSLLGGMEWDRMREQGQLEAEFAVHILGPVISVRSGVVNREIRKSLRLNEDQPLGSNYILSIRTERFTIPVELSRFQYLDYFDPDWKQQLRMAVTARLSQLGQAQVLPSGESITYHQRDPDPTVQWKEVSEVGPRYAARAAYPAYPATELSWEFVNARVSSVVLGKFLDERHHVRSVAEADERESYSFEWELTTQEIWRTNQVISLRYYEYSFTGGAHGNHAITTMNFVTNFGQVDAKRLFDFEDEVAREVLSTCITLLPTFIDGPVEESLQAYYQNEERPIDQVWGLISEYSLTAFGLTINFSPYDILPYVYGAPEVNIPWQRAVGWISPPIRAALALDSGATLTS